MNNQENKNEEKFEYLIASTEIEYRLICDKLKNAGIRVKIIDDLPDLQYLGGTSSLFTKKIFVPVDKLEEASQIIGLEGQGEKKQHWKKEARDRKAMWQVIRAFISLALLALVFNFLIRILNNL